MVTIKGFKTIKKEDGDHFNILILQGGVEPVMSQKTGRIYFTARTARVSTTFDEQTCKEIIGTTYEGEIVKVSCDPYKILIEDTGEEIELKHRWDYIDEDLKAKETHLIKETDTVQ